MKLILLIFAISIFLFTSKKFGKIANMSDPIDIQEADGPNDETTEKKENKPTFQEHFRKELQENNEGDIGRKKFHPKFQKFTDMVQSLAVEFGAEAVFPQGIEINENKMSKIEVSFKVLGLLGTFADKIQNNFKGGALKTDSMEYQLLFKLCIPVKNKPYVDMHCAKDECEDIYVIHSEKHKCDNIPNLPPNNDENDYN